MQRIEILAQLEALGLKTSTDGLLFDEKGRIYGTMSEQDMIMDAPYKNTKDIIEFDEIKQMGMMDNGTFNVMIGDTMHMYRPGRRVAQVGTETVEVELSKPALVKLDNTLLSLKTIFPEIFPDYATQLYYDELQECAMCDMAMFGCPSEIVRVTDATMVTYYLVLEQRLAERGINIKFANHVRDEAFTYYTYQHRRNQFREWIESLEWDGKPRLRTWFRDLFGVRAPPLEAIGRDMEYIEAVTEAWFMGAVARAYQEVKHEIVPVLISPQGIGKGLGLRYTAGRDKWYVDTNADVKDPKTFLDTVRGAIIVELSEATQIRDKNSEMLKSFISKSADQMRKAYARYEERFPRHFVLIASSNLNNVFTDITGNRRFFPMYCEPSKATREFAVDRSYGQDEVEQLWAEALQMYRDGHRWYLPENVAELSRMMQDYSSVDNPNISIIDDWLDDPMNGFNNIGARVSRQLIMEQVFRVEPNSIVPKEAESAFRAWVNGNQQWQKLSQTIRIDGKACRGYERILLPGQKRAITRIKIRNGIKGTSSPEQRLMDYVVRNQSREEDVLDPSQFQCDDMDALMDLGYIYSTYKEGQKQYVLAVLPGGE